MAAFVNDRMAPLLRVIARAVVPPVVAAVNVADPLTMIPLPALPREAAVLPR